MARSDAVTALNRFGFGARPGDLRKISADPRAAVLAELDRLGIAAIDHANTLPSAAQALRAQREFDEQRWRIDHDKVKAFMAPVNPVHKTVQDEFEARLEKQLAAQIGVAERLVMFWSNHFCISISKAPHVRAMAGAFEREAIRPHVFGRFADMLQAVIKHPAMLSYLDNHQSIGPSTRRGAGKKRGRNENLAREIIELHTLGVDGGYSQQDVIALANIITGWTFSWPDNDTLYGGRFTFASGHHEPGSQNLLGKTFPDEGLKQGEAALHFLAEHASTARHVARKLAVHFHSDDAPESLIRRLEKSFLDSKGNLLAVAKSLVSADEVWVPEVKKLRPPAEFIIAAERLLSGQRHKRFNPVVALSSLGQPLWNPPSPKGFPDTDAHWNSPAGIKARLDVAARYAVAAGAQDPNELVDEAFGSSVSAESREAVRRAESRVQGIAILLMLPEFQRR